MENSPYQTKRSFTELSEQELHKVSGGTHPDHQQDLVDSSMIYFTQPRDRVKNPKD
ncbi:hypothetical protein [Alteromonas oceanisediminis]|uniref:hypothetical protein n=1 Tax=Alteromonas oceanisediminis TaxID=2836180 RepID=UPI001BDA91EF|nr:hypothetical protein [Alteromonas oceanisediminis]MBT0587918.1 hypothetical protein [Alteromonas oceanisediminis]